MGRQNRAFHGIPYSLDPGFEFVATGRRATGGAGEFLHNGTPVDSYLKFPAAEFSVLVQLMQKSLQAGGKHGNAFVLTEELAKEMLRTTGLGGNDHQSVHRAISRLRKRLKSKRILAYAKAKGLEWDEIVQRHPTLGYRINLPHESLHLELLDPP
jgi:hypothetical protein